MHRPLRRAAPLLLAVLSGAAAATDKVVGDRHTFASPNGVAETCVALAKMPGGVYSADDRAQEKALCALDVYDRHVALCPKLKSTSPGTFVYELSKGPLAGDQQGFEAKVCPRGDIVVPEADGPPAGFKVTMNAKGTSGTFATASRPSPAAPRAARARAGAVRGNRRRPIDRGAARIWVR